MECSPRVGIAHLIAIDDKAMKPTFSTLIFLTFVTVILLIPFVFSPWYLPILRESNFQFHLFLKGEFYKQTTGYLSLFFVLLEMILTARKRGKSWKISVSLPGSIQFWRRLHIFLGVALLGTTLVHTTGSQGLNFNAVFLWVFFAVTLSALVGVVAETSVLEYPRKYLGFTFAINGKNSQPAAIPKGVLIRNLRLVWLNTHIFLVSVFCVMLVFHIILAYYYQ